MLNFANLSDMEFEELCRDVMSRELGISLRSFGRGRDLGIDLTDNVVHLENVVQVKHYPGSATTTLINNLKKEREKLDRLETRPKRYYICCSNRLLPQQIRELYDAFREYMDSEAQIYTGDRIDEILKKEGNEDIVRKHYKLWIEVTGILERIHDRDCFVDCEVLLAYIQQDYQRFVPTNIFERALQSLDEHRVLCIVGSPGVGKTMTSKMLVMHYAAKGYRVRYTSDVSNLTALKNALTGKEETAEVILLDDCFGQAYFEMKSGQGTELVQLIEYVRSLPGKVLILNSRFTIYQEAKKKEEELERCWESGKYQEFVLHVGEMSTVDKARLFYNHLYFYGIPGEYIDAVRKDRNYAPIVEHPNFNPRIIEYVCSPHRFRSVAPEAFPGLVLQHLDNPKRMWQNEYEYKLQSEDRILLQTIYSLTNRYARRELVEKCYAHRIRQLGQVDNTIGSFRSSLRRLKDGMIQEITVRGETMLGMVNPSVNDFLDGYLEENPGVRQGMVDAICNMWQITRLIPNRDIPEYCVNLIRTGKIHDLIYRVPENKPAFISYFLLSQHLMEESCRKDLWDFLDHPTPLYFHIYLPSRMMTNMVLDYMNQKLWDFYGLSRYFSRKNKVYQLLKIFDFRGVVGCIKLLSPFITENLRDSFQQQAMRCLKKKIDNYLDDMLSYQDGRTIVRIDKALERAISYDVDGPELNVEYLESILNTRVGYKLIEGVQSLGEPFDSLTEYVRNNTIHISDPEKVAEEYLRARRTEEPVKAPKEHRKVISERMQECPTTMDDIFNR